MITDTTPTIRFAAAHALVMRWLPRVAGVYLLTMVILAAIIHLACDRTWWGTALAFAPRWLWAVPAGLLLPMALYWRKRALGVMVLASLILVFLVLGFQIGWRGWWSSDSSAAFQLRVLTCNADARALNPTALREYIATVDANVVAIQVMSNRHQQAVFADQEWHQHRDKDLVLASRFPILRATPVDDPILTSHYSAATQYLLATPAGEIPFVCLHLESPRRGLLAIRHRLWRGRNEMQANVDHRQRQSAVVRAGLGADVGNAVVVGDFNTLVESNIFTRDWNEFQNAFNVAGWGRGNTHFTRLTAVRIDHVLAGGNWQVAACDVGPHVGSAHRPVVAHLNWQSPATLATP